MPADSPHFLARVRAALADRYRIERELGRGGMAAVYLAWDLRHDRPVALKLLHPGLAQTLGPDRFLREIRLAARLQHPHILSVLDSGEICADDATAPQLWFTMPFVEGETLRDRLARERQLPVDDALRITREVADGLQYAHRHGVIHRDVKPENILLSDRHALVADFGIARALQGGHEDTRLTETGITIGTPQYMSPEQAAGERELDPRTDVYSLGCVLYEMLAGEPPFTGPSQQAILAKRLSEPVPRIGCVRDVPAAVEQAVTRALSRAPADRFASAAALGDALDPERLGVSAPTVPARAPRRGPWGRAAIVIVLAALALAGTVLGLRGRRTGGNAALVSAAVLPFADLSPGKDQEYFSDGLTEELISSLSQIEGLRVAARTSSFQFKGRAADVREVGRKLDVGAVLEGSVRRSGNRVRITVQLVNARDGYQLWSDAYDRELADVFAVQEEIARAIVAALRVRLRSQPDSTLAVRPTGDLEAYDLYLKGRFAWNQRNATALPEAVRYFEQAVARDSGFAKAWAGLADAYILVVPYAGASRAETWPKAKAAAARALALDSTLAEAHTSLAYGAMIYDWDWPAAEASFRRAIAANPRYATGHHWYADFLAGRGRLDEALREMTLAHELDPLSRIIGVELGWVYYLMHRNDEAEREMRRTLALDPNYAQGHFLLGALQIQQRRYADAIASLRQAGGLSGAGDLMDDLAGTLAYAYARSGDRAAALEKLADLQRRASRGEVGPYALAIAYTGLGDIRRGLEYLNKAIDQRDIFLPEDFHDPLLDPLRSDPAFAPVRARMGLDPEP